MGRKILVTKIPQGTAPYHIRKQCIGVEFHLKKETCMGSYTRKIKFHGQSKYWVDYQSALASLKNAGKTKALDYWTKHPVTHFSFEKEKCEIIAL